MALHPGEAGYEDEGTLQVEKLITDTGGTVTGSAVLPDGTGCITASYPLPKDHWIYEPIGDPPPALKTSDQRNVGNLALIEKIRTAAKWAIRGATDSGSLGDFDPDALVQNLVYALMGNRPFQDGYLTVDRGTVACSNCAVGMHGLTEKEPCDCDCHGEPGGI